MKALQLHYTSCRKGFSGGSGFQTRCMSSGINQEEQREIERWGTYRPPRDARQEPSDEEIAAELPVAFRSYRLTSGRFAVTRSVYAGQDYSSRWGNFFAHTVVFERDSFLPFWPIDFYEWEGWHGKLSKDEDSETLPEPLPAVDLAGISPGESFQVSELSAFLREGSEREILLVDMARALLLVREKSRALVVRDTPNSCLYWIGCLQKLLPVSHVLRFTFSTYQDDPRGCADVNATSGETAFVFNESERQYRFFMFDVLSGQKSDVPSQAGDYFSIAASWMAGDPAALEGFHAFMGFFSHDGPIPDLVHAARLYQLSTRRLAVFDGQVLSGMIDFASQFATVDGRVRLLGVLGAAAEVETTRLTAEDLQRLLRFLSQGAAETGLEDHRNLAFRTWLSLVRGHVVASGAAVQTARSELEDLWKRFPEGRSALAGLFFAEPFWTSLPKLSLDAGLFLLETSFRGFVALDREPTWETGPVPVLVDRAVEAGAISAMARPLFDSFPRDPDALWWLTDRLIRHQQGGPTKDEKQRVEGLGRALRPALSRLDPQAAHRYRSRLEAEGLFNILLGEGLEWCEKCPDPSVAYLEYEKAVLSRMPAFSKEARDLVVQKLFQTLSEGRRSGVAVEWLRSESFKKLSNTTASRIVEFANSAVSLRGRDPAGDDTEEIVRSMAKKLSIRLMPDRPFLREAIRNVRNARTPLKGLDPAALRASASALAPAEYQEFLREFFLPGLERSLSIQDHRIMLAAIFSATRSQEMQAAYAEFFEKQRDPAWTRAMEAALNHWIHATPRESAGLEPVLETARTGLIGVFLRLERKDIDAITAKVEKAFPEEHLQLRWSALLGELEKRHRNPLRKIMKFFRRD